MVTMSFLESGPMFTWSVTVGCSFQACWEESVKYQSCLIFLRLFPTLVTAPKYIHLATDMLVNLKACQLHFPPFQLIQQACLYHASCIVHPACPKYGYADCT